MANFFSKLFTKSAPLRERKFYDQSYSQYTSMFTGAQSVITPTQAAAYYLNIAPLYTAVSLIATSVSKIDIIIEKESTDDVIYEHPLLELLEHPNAISTGQEFLEQLASFYVLTGNAFVVATGPVNRPPLELQIINPINVQLKEGVDGFLDTVTVYMNNKNSRVFTRKEVNGKFRYYDGVDGEILHIKSFNARAFGGDLWGMSPLNPISLELDQYVEASTHNLSLLKRGARPSGALKFNEMLTDDQFQRYQQQVDTFYSGSKNAGRLLLLENADFQEMSQSNRDMDFAALKVNVTNTVYTSLRIPLPLIDASFSTYDNMKVSTINFYDQAVLPIVDKLLSELNGFLVLRYDPKQTIELSYDPESLEALEPRRVEKVAILQTSGVLTINELRLVLGYPPVDGGDNVYTNSNMIPVTENIMMDLDKPELVPEEDEEPE